MIIRARLLLGFALVCLALVAAPLTIYMVNSGRSLHAARLKHAGIAPSTALLKLVQLQQQHRGLSAGVLGGNAMMETQRAATQVEADKAVEAFDAIVQSDSHNATLIADWRRGVDTWQGLAHNVSSRAISGEESFAGHTALIADTLKLLDRMVDYFGLSYDPTGQDYHLTMALLVHLPTVTEGLGQARARGSVLLAQRRVTLADRVAVMGLIGNIERAHEYMARELGKALALNPGVQSDLDHIVQKSRALAQQAVDLARTQVVEPETRSYSPDDYFARFTLAIDGQFALLDQAMVNLDAALRARIGALRNEQIRMIGIMVLVVAFAVWLGIRIVRAVRQDVALEARRAEAERAEAALRRLNEDLEAEAKRVGQVLHDEAGQILALVYLELDRCARDLPPAAQERLQEVRGHLDLVDDQLRHLSHELRPTILEDLGVVPALKFLADGVSKRTGLAVTVEGSMEGRLPVSVETALYRIVQEGLANATKHGKAGSARVQLQQENGQIRCAILDNGIGFDVPAALATKGDRGLGLIGIRERLRTLDGELQITSAPGRGTALHITIPLGA